MHALNRRDFLGMSLGGLAAAGLGSAALAKDKKVPSGLDTLFLTWQRDPTTTMTVQWIGPPSSE
ncbi:MAG TPA: twin-arginine translocation signal domain-containing protein, partial [Pirellulales bacterium]|nr:twin-arginine translocation signal domain-containing protein [Pirellulales bacterium]